MIFMNNKKAKELQNSQEKGCEARAFYESVLNEPSTSNEHKKRTTSEKSLQKTLISNNVDEKLQFQVRKSDLFKAGKQDNIEYVKEALEIVDK